MDTHYHFSAVSAIWCVALMIATMGTLHLLALTYGETRAARAYISLGL